MAFGVKVKLDVEVIGGSKLRSQIQQAVENATQGKPIKIRHLSIDLGRQEAQRISKQLESAFASQDITIKIAKIDASKPVAQLKKQLTTMLSGLSITGLKDFLGADGVASSYDKATAAANKLAEAQENVRRRTEEANVALKTLKTVQSTLNTVFKSSSGVGDQAKLEAYLTTYRELLVASESAKNMQGDAQAAEVIRITAATVALKQQVDAQLDAEKAAKRKAAATKSAEEIAKQAAAEQERAAKKEANLSRQAVQLRQRINSWIQNNTKAYAANKIELDSLMSMLQDEAAVSDVALAQIRQRFEEINTTAHTSGITGKSFFDTLKAGWAKFGGWSLVTKSMMTAVNAVKSMVSAVIALDSAMTELKKVTDLTSQAYANFASNAAQTAKRVGASVADTISATADFARLGYSIEDAAALAEAALIYKNVGDGIDDISIATESLISTLKAFGIEADNAMGVIDMFNEVGNNFAISSSGIGDALQRSASALAAAGNTIEQSIGLVTAMNSVVQNPEAVGTALKTLTMYLRAAKTEAEEAGIETDGMANSISELRGELKDLTGIDIMLDENTFKSTYQILKEISGVWADLTDVSRSNVLNLLGGKRNANVIASLVTNFEDAEEAMKSAMSSLGSATAENEKYIDSINGKIAVLKATWEELSSSVVNNSLVKTILDIATALTSVATALSKIHLLLPALTGISIFGSWVKGKVSIRSIADEFGELIAAGKEFSEITDILSLKTDGFTQKQRNQVLELIKHTDAFKNLSKAQRSSLESAISVNAASGVAAAGLRKLGVAAKSAWSSLSMLSKASIILTVIELVVSGIYAITNSVSESRQKMVEDANEIISTYEEAEKTVEDNKKTLEGLRSEFETLSAGVDENGQNISLTASEYERYLSIIDQLVDISPDIVKGYDTERGALVNYKTALDEAIASQDQLLDNQRRIKLAEGETVIGASNSELTSARSEMDKWYSTFTEMLTKRNKEIDGLFGTTKGYEGVFGEDGLFNSILGMSSLGGQYGVEGGIGDYYDNLIELYKRRDEVIAYVRSASVDSGKFDEDSNPIMIPLWTADQIEELESRLDQIGVIYDKMLVAEAKAVDWYDLWAQDRGLYVGIPEGVQNKARDAIAELYDPDDIDASKSAIRDYFTSLNEAFHEESVRGLLDMADALETGRVSLPDYEAAVEAFSQTSVLETGVLATVVSYLNDLSNAYVQVQEQTENSSTSTKGLATALEALTKGYDIISKAEADMASNGGLSASTLQSILSVIGEDGKITDYITTENGLLQLNISKWDERSKKILNDDKTALEAQKANLEETIGLFETIAEYDNIQGPLTKDQQAEYDAAKEAVSGYVGGLEKAEEQLADTTAQIAIYDAALKGTPEDPLNLTEFLSDLDKIEGNADALLSALDGLRSGVALNKSELIALAQQYDDLMQNPNWLGAETVEEQSAILSGVLSTYEAEYDAIIQKQIEALEEAKANAEEGSELASVLGTVIANLKTISGETNLALEPVDVTPFESLEQAISQVEKASQLLTYMNNSGSSDLDILQDLLNICQEFEGVDLSDFVESFDGEKIDWKEDGVSAWIEKAINDIEGLDQLEISFPGITEWLKENAKAAIDASAAYEKLSKAMSGIQSTADILKTINEGGSDMDIVSSLIDLAEETSFNVEDLMNFGSDTGIVYNIGNITAAMEEQAAGLSTLEELWPGFTDSLIQSAMASEEATTSYDALSDAIDAVSTASSLLTDIQSGEGNVLDMLQTVSDMAQQSGQSINDFFTIDDGTFNFKGSAITTWATDVVNRLNQFNDITPETRATLINLIVAEVEAATAAERMAEAYEDAKGALSGMEGMAHGAEITYEAFKSLIEIDARYSQAVEYQNGVLSLNAEKYDAVTEAILAETLAMAEANALAIVLSDDYQELTSKIGSLNAEEQQRLDNMNAEIMGYSVLASELNNATSAYNRFVNASSDPDSTRYGAARDAFDVVNNTLYEKDSDVYGKIGRDQFRYAVDYLIDPEIEVNSDAFDDAWDRVKRYITEGGEGVGHFYDDLVKEGFVNIDTGELYAPLEDVAEKLGISVELVRTMFDELNEYQEVPIKINWGETENEIGNSMSAIERYLGEAQAHLVNFYEDLVGGGYMDAATHQLTASVQEIADEMGINVGLAQQMIDNLNATLSEDMQIKPEVDTTSVEAGGAAADGAAASAMTAEEKVESLTEALGVLEAELTELNPATISLDADSFIKTVGSVSTALGNIIAKLNAIARKSPISVVVNTTERINRVTTYSSVGSAINGALSGNRYAAASGTDGAPGGRTLVGELGMETVVDPNTNRWYTVGSNGAEFVNLPKGAIVFNADQTKELFSAGRIAERGQAMASGNAAASVSSIFSSVAHAVGGAISGVSTAISNGLNKVKAELAASSSVSQPTTSKSSSSSSKKSSGSSSKGSSKSSSGGSSSAESKLESLKKQYEELNKQTEHLIEHQEFLYRQSERGLNYDGMEDSLQKQAELYRKMMSDSQRAVNEMIAAGAKDTDAELQAMEQSYWDAYDNLYKTLDEINALYVDALNSKIDSLQTAYSNLAQAAEEYNSYGGITVDTFQSLISNGVQYLSMLDNINGKYVINTEGVKRMVAAEKEQLAVESAMSYINQLRTALTDKDSQAVANLVNLTNELSDASWSAVYAQAALLKNMGLSNDEFKRVISNIDALRDIARDVITDITVDLDEAVKATSDSYKAQSDALDKILELTQDLIEAETKDRMDAIEDEIDAYKKIIDLKKESLKTTRDENDYAKNVADKVKGIADLQSRIDKLSLDDSREARAERAQLEKELSELQGELGELQSDHSYDAQVDALDKMADSYEAGRQQEIDDLEASISSAEKLYQEAIERLNSQWSTLYEDLIAWNTESGSSLNSEITENWLKAAEAVQLYGSYVEAVTGVQNASDALENGGTSNIVGEGTPTDVESLTPPVVETPEPAPAPAPAPPPVKMVQITSGTWNVRKGAGTSYNSIGYARQGEKYEYAGEKSGNWYAIKYGGSTRWVYGGSNNLQLIEETPRYHSGGVVGDKATLKDNEVLSVLEEGELILTDKMKKAAYKLIDFKDYLEKKLGTRIGSVAAPLPRLPALAGVGSLGNGRTDIGQMNFSPTIQVEINHSGTISDNAARQYGKTIADTAIDELYEGFRQRGIGKIFGSKPKQ